MRIVIFAAASLASVMLAGCQSVGKLADSDRPVPISAQSYGSGVIEKPGLIYVWPPYVSAAVVDDKGNRCVLAASGAKTLNLDSSFGLKLESFKKSIGGLDVSAQEKLIEAFVKTSQADSDAAFADIALFHLCMLDQNGTFGKGDDGQMKPKSGPILDAYLRTIELARSNKSSAKVPPEK